MELGAVDFLVGFVSFASDKDDVGGRGECDGGGDGLESIGDAVGTSLVCRGESGEHLVNDFKGVFVAGIVGGEDDYVT